MTPPTPRAYSYLRFSSGEQARGDSFRRHTALAEDYALANGLELDSSLRLADLGVSAYRGANAATGALAAFLRAVEDGKVPPGSVLLVESLDRISRAQVIDAQALFLQIVGAGIEIVTLADGKRYSKESINGNPLDLVFSILIAIRANEESATKGRRIASAWARKREQASERPLTSIAPGWLELRDGRWQVVEGRADVVRRIYRLAAEGHGARAIAKALNDGGTATFRHGERWHKSFVVKLLETEAVIGTFVPHIQAHQDGRLVRVPQDPVPGYFPPIVPAELFERARAIRAGRAPRGRHAAAGPAAIRSALAGLARCAACGAGMTRVVKHSRPRLVCSRARVGAGCKYRSLPCDWIEANLWVSLPMVLAGRTMGTLLDQGTPALAKLSREIGALEAELQSVIDLHRIVGASPALAERIRAMETSIGALKAQRRRSASQRPRKPSATTRLIEVLKDPNGTPAALNLALRETVDHVVVDPDDPDSRGGALRIAWRDGTESWMGLVREPGAPDPHS